MQLFRIIFPTGTAVRKGLTGNVVLPAGRRSFTGIQRLFVRVLLLVPSWLAGAEYQVCFYLPHLGRRGKAIQFCWPGESRIVVTMWKNLPPRAFATGLPESTMCFLPCRNTAGRALLTHRKKCFSRFLCEFDMHIGPLGGCHGISATWCPDLSWSLPARGVSWELNVHHSYVPLF